jgi:hypothetical protein
MDVEGHIVDGSEIVEADGDIAEGEESLIVRPVGRGLIGCWSRGIGH